MKSYYRLMLGQQSAHAAACFAGNFIGVDYEIEHDLTGRLPERWRDFNREFIPIFLSNHPDKTKIGAGLACGAVWTVAKGFNRGDIILCPDGNGVYRVAEVTSDYCYAPGEVLPHRRGVRWLPLEIARSAMSEALQNSTGSIGTVSNVTVHQKEIERFLSEVQTPLVALLPEVEDPAAFAMEKHLEDFLVRNWAQTELAREFSIYEENGELVGQQYPTDVGPIDILAISRDKKRLLVLELKRGRASDVVVGQILRYMGYVKEQIAEADQTVEGAIIALEDDQKLRLALSMVPSIRFFRYQVSFRLLKA
jgi:restriction system protein